MGRSPFDASVKKPVSQNRKTSAQERLITPAITVHSVSSGFKQFLDHIVIIFVFLSCQLGFTDENAKFLSAINKICYYNSSFIFQGRRGSLDGYGSPPTNGYFPHDLDDIYEYKTDHQYFTHTGATRDASHDKFAITNETQRNCLFKNYATHSMDEQGPFSNRYPYDVERQLPYRGRFDNTSFIRNLHSSISQTSVDSGHNTGGSTTSSNNSKEKLSSNCK